MMCLRAALVQVKSLMVIEGVLSNTADEGLSTSQPAPVAWEDEDLEWIPEPKRD